LQWRTRLQPIRTSAEITAHIKIFPVHQPYLYQKLSKKATQLRLLGMSYQQIAKSLNINKRTAIKACRYKSNQ
jgi:DNA-binding CsgD family transcriptional regulator